MSKKLCRVRLGERPDLLFNEVAPCQGETTVEPGLRKDGTFLLDIQAEGD